MIQAIGVLICFWAFSSAAGFNLTDLDWIFWLGLVLIFVGGE